MATPKTNAVQKDHPSVYCIYDSTLPEPMYGDDVLTRSISKARTRFIATALNDVKGLVFSDTRLRLFYCAEGFEGNPGNTLKLEFTALYGTGMGKVASNLVSVTGQLEGGAPKIDQ